MWFRRDRAYVLVLGVVFLAQGAAAHRPSLPIALTPRAAFYTMYDSIFTLYCPLGPDETNLPGIRMVSLSLNPIHPAAD